MRQTPAMRRIWLLLVALALLLTACAGDAPLDTLEPEGPAARTIDNLLNGVLVPAAIVFVFVEGGILWLAWRYRAGRRRTEGDEDDEDDIPAQTHGNLILEIAWTAVPALMLGGVAVFTVGAIFDLADEPEDAMQVEVIGQQWWWEFRYDTDDDGEVDIVTANEMVVPAGTPIDLDITSRDVIHSFWIPALNGKLDAVPGRHHDLTIEADEPGIYWGQCTEFCGLSHANMRMRTVALSPEEFDEWVDNQLEPAVAPETAAQQSGQDFFVAQCGTCHQINGVNDVEEADLVAGSAPNLTHLMSRSTFAGSIFRLYEEADDEDLDYLALPDVGTLDRAQLEAWLRDPPGLKPMDPDDRRGMPNFNLSEDQIDQLVDYLSTLR